MKKSMVAAIMLCTAGTASAEFSGNIGVTSDYLWRGVSQSDGAAAISGGLDYAHDGGIYLGTWASNVDFGDDTSYEVDFYGGYANEVSGLSYDLGYIYYAYPNAGFEGDSYDGDYGELYLNLGWKWFGLNTSYATNADDDVDIYEDGLYVEGTFSYELSDTLSLGVAVGHQSYDEEIPDELEDYVNYNGSLTKATDLGDFTFMVSDTDLDGDDPIVTVSWNYYFDL